MYSVSLPSSYTKPNNQKKDSAQNLCIRLNLPNEIFDFFCKARFARSGAGVGRNPNPSLRQQPAPSDRQAGVVMRERSPR